MFREKLTLKFIKWPEFSDLCNLFPQLCSIKSNCPLFFTVVYTEIRTTDFVIQCLPDTHEIAGKSGRTTERTFITVPPRRFSNIGGIVLPAEYLSLNWHERE